MFRKFLAVLVVAIFMAACASNGQNEKAKKGAAIGAATGAVAGAVIGNQAGGKNRTGAVVGAVVGAGVGAAIGHRMDQQQRELEQIQGVDVTRTANDELNVVLKNDILFDYDSAELRSDSRQTLSQMADVFERYPDTSIMIEGYADSTGTAQYNEQLSDRRASSVASYLSGQGVQRSRMVTRGYGESNPVATNATAEGRQLNRRVELHVKANPTQSAANTTE